MFMGKEMDEKSMMMWKMMMYMKKAELMMGIGVLVIVYGLWLYAQSVLGWTRPGATIAAGVLLVILGLLKMWWAMSMQKMMKK